VPAQGWLVRGLRPHRRGADIGLVRIVALRHRSSTLYHIRYYIRCLYF
jgi:hypothetical protein